jgi:hypothetical protein
MRAFAIVILVLAAAGAAASWIVAVVLHLRTTRTISGAGRGPLRLLAILAWPFAVKPLPAHHAARMNKALVAFVACLLLAFAATSATTNLSRYSR